MNDELRLRRAATFDEVAELYDRARRELPDELLTDLFDMARLASAGANVLEIGCGTGQATLGLARRGCRLVGLELGPNLARIAQRKLEVFPNATIVNQRFETWQPGGEAFDVVFAANSWHWLDPAVRYSRAASVLRPGGILAFTSSFQVFPPGFDPVFNDIHASYEAIGEARMQWPPLPPDHISDLADEIRDSGHFDEVLVTRRLHVEVLTADEYVALMGTASDHRLMQPAKREWLLDQMHRLISATPGGRIRTNTLTILHVARKRS